MGLPLIAIGPKRLKPAWQWFGIDLVKELRKYYNVEIFSKTYLYKFKPDLILHIKCSRLLHRSIKHSPTIFLPIDNFALKDDLMSLKKCIKKCKHIIIHCHRLRKYFPTATYIEHHLKYWIEENLDFKENGRILWVGHSRDAIFLLKYLEHEDKIMKMPLLLLAASKRSIPMPKRLKRENNIEIKKWTIETHLEALKICKAAIDIKGTNFKQIHKPPTKVINFLASGLPVAINSDSAPAEHLAHLGLPLPLPTESRFLSKEYWQEVQTFKYKLRDLCSLERIGLQYKEIIDKALC